MTTIIDWFRGIFSDNPQTRTKTEQKTQSLEEAIKGIQRSGCGCSRHDARHVFNKFKEGMQGKELIDLYMELESNLHSYCSNTGSSKTMSNARVIETVYKAVEDRMQSADIDTIDSELKSWKYVVHTGNKEVYGGLVQKFHEVLKQKSVEVANMGHYQLALRLLDIDDNEAKVMAGAYFQEALQELRKSDESEKIKKAHRLAKIAGRDAFAKRAGDIGFPQISTSIEETVRRVSYRGSYQYKEQIRDEKRRVDNLKYKAKQEYDLKTKDACKKLEEIRRVKSRLGVSEHASLDREMTDYQACVDEQKSFLEARLTEIGTGLERLHAEKSEFDQYMETTLEKIEDRTLTRSEYRALRKIMYDIRSKN